MADSLRQDRLRVFAVIVLYKMKPSESVTLSTIQAAISCFGAGQADIKILLYDNTPGGQNTGVLPTGVQYKADFGNSGLAKAYNYALEIAHEEGFDWLLTLDQDTSLPLDFVGKLVDAAALVAPLSMVAAIVPCIYGDGRVISPMKRIKYWPQTRRFPDGFVGISEAKAYAVNSASTLRVSSLKAIGGYDPTFPLDQSDIVMYHRLYCNGLHIFVAGNIRVEHEVSIFDLKNRSTLERYESILRAEEAFHDEYMGKVEGVVLLLRILHLLIYKLYRTGGNPAYFKVGLRFLWRRIFYSRKHRIADWKQSVSRSS